MKHKFSAIPKIKDDIRFGSTKEADYYSKLRLLQKQGEILFFLRQVPFDLPGGVKYRLDFIEFWKPRDGEACGDIVFTEVKGYKEKMGMMKIKMVEDLYNIKINVV